MLFRYRNKAKAAACVLATFFFLSTFLFAQAAKPVDNGKVALKDRIWMATRMYDAVQMYFAHWKAVPDLDIDAEYKRFVGTIEVSDDRRTFDLAALEFFGALKNGHTSFNDPWLDGSDPKPVGFEASKAADGRFIVIRSANSEIHVGTELQAIDGKPFGQFFEENEKYLTGSSEAARLKGFFYRPYLFPRKFDLTVSGKTVTVDRYTQKLNWPKRVDETQGKVLDGGIALLTIPSFGEERFEQKAVEFIRANASAKALIIDVRGNGGGTTPSKLIAALMDRPYYDWVEATSANVGVFGAYSQLGNLVPRESRDAEIKNVIDTGSALERVEIRFANKRNIPDGTVYKGRVVVLADSGCASACEDFVMPLKTSGRAEVYGSSTEGSTGQPFMYQFENGMNFRVGAKRAYFPNGSDFEGIGITPTVPIEPTPGDIRAGRDVVLAKAIADAQGQ